MLEKQIEDAVVRILADERGSIPIGEGHTDAGIAARIMKAVGEILHERPTLEAIEDACHDAEDGVLDHLVRAKAVATALVEFNGT